MWSLPETVDAGISEFGYMLKLGICFAVDSSRRRRIVSSFSYLPKKEPTHRLPLLPPDNRHKDLFDNLGEGNQKVLTVNAFKIVEHKGQR
jgi:hypothetical protein